MKTKHKTKKTRRHTSFRLSDRALDALKTHADSVRRSQTMALELLIEEHLIKAK